MTVSLSMRAAWQQVAAEAEALRDRHKAVDHFDVYNQPMPTAKCATCLYPTAWPCPDRLAADSIRVTALAQINALNETAERLQAMIDYLECAGDPPCVKDANAYCDECAVRWDAEAVLAVLIPDPAVLLAESPRPDKAEQ